MHDAKDSYHEPRVPDGVAYCHLDAKMQAVTIVYLNCFVDECLAYLAALLHFCPKPLTAQQEASAAAAQHTPPSASARRSLSGALPSGMLPTPKQHRRSTPSRAGAVAASAANVRKATLKRLALAVLLDVEMKAPVIEMPRNSTSEDSLELDLGMLRLKNRVALLADDTQAADLLELTIQEARCFAKCHALPTTLP